MPLRICDLFPEREITITFPKDIFNSDLLYSILFYFISSIYFYYSILSQFLGISLIFIIESPRLP